METRRLHPKKSKVLLNFLLLFVPFFLLLVLTLGAFTRQAINKDMVSLHIGSAFHLQTGAHAIRHEIAAVISDLTYLKDNPDLQNYFLTGDKMALTRAADTLQKFSRAQNCYDQIRFINKKGLEEIRVNFDHDRHTLVAPKQLQDKSQRYYFTDTLTLSANEIFISPLDLNIDNGKLDEPYKPMLRFATPLFDQQGQKQGIIILNYRARLLLDQYEQTIHSTKVSSIHRHFIGDAMLLNPDGYWLLSPDKADEWGFMLGQQTTMANKFPEAWQEIHSHNKGNIVTQNGYFAYITVYPLGEHHISSTGSNSAHDLSRTMFSAADYTWKLVSHIPARKLQTINSLTSRFPWLLFASLALIATPLILILAWTLSSRQLDKNNLRHREEQYHQLYQLAPMPYQSVNEAGHILDINQEWQRIMGYDMEEVVGRPFTDFVIPEQREEFQTRFSEFTEQGRINDLLLKLLHKDGSIILASISGLIIRDNDGHFLRTQSVFQDVTHQHQIHTKLADNLALLESIINTIPSIICLKDHQGRWLLANQLYLDICGLAGINYQGKSDNELARHSSRLQEELLKTKKADLKAWEAANPQHCEMALILPNNRGEAIFDIVRQPSFRDGKPNNLLMVGFDITDRKRNEETTRLNQLRFQALCKLHGMETHAMADLHASALETAGLLSESKLGYLHCFARPNQPALFTTWSAAGPLFCQAPEQTSHNPDAQAIWQECLSSRKAVIHNNYPALEQRHGLPLGHLSIINHMAIPLLDGDSIYGVLGVANKGRPYSRDDSEQLTLFAANIMAVFKQRHTSMALKQSQEEWRRTFDAISDVVTIQDEAMHISQINRAGTILLEATRKEILGKNCYEIFHGSSTPCPGCPILDGLNAFTPFSAEVTHKKLGKTFLVTASPIRDDQGNVTGIAHFAKDISATKNLEEQLRQSQKMEAVGTLAGGVAHDFNNILTAVSGYLELAMMKIPPEEPARADLGEVKKAADRAADLVRQLLLFSRKKPLRQVVININETIEGLLKMLQRLIGEDITVITDLDQDLWQVMGDVGNLEQVLMNLTVNAQDAMPEGGRLTIRTANKVLSPHDIPKGSSIQPGKYVRISVADSGMGMDDATREHIFEPFFTTKETGKGTGLGLAVAYGIIHEYKGWLEVESAQGEGTNFRIFLPAITSDKKSAAIEKKKISLAQIKGHGERILLVEDEVMLNEFAFKALSRYGYQVYATYSAEEAQAIWDRENGDFDLVFSDVVLPGKTGLQLVEELRSRKAQVKRLLTSGYTDKKSQSPLIKDKDIPFLAKPYDILDMLIKIKTILTSS